MAAKLHRVLTAASRHALLYHRAKNNFPLGRTFCSTFLRYGPRKFSEKHEWVSVEDNIGTIGITNYAQEALGEVVYVQLPEMNETYIKDSECGVVESVKAVNEIYTPVSGTVTEVNEQLSEQPNAINESCYDRGWICKLKLSDPKELDSLMHEDEYEKYLKSME